MDTQLIGFAGMQGAGKDYMYSYLQEVLDPLVVNRAAFADGVRREVAFEIFDALGLPTQGVAAGSWKKPYTDGQRFILQQWGTEFRRAQDPDYWVKLGIEYIRERQYFADVWCITDVRFANEAEAIQKEGGVVVQVVAGPKVRAERNGVTLEALQAQANHASEVIDFACDYVVLNNGGTPELEPEFLRWLEIA